MLEADVGELGAPDAATDLADHPNTDAAEEQPADSVPAEPSSGQPLDPNADQEATDAAAMEGTPSAGACESGPLFSTSPPADGNHLGVATVCDSHQCWTCNYCEKQHGPRHTYILKQSLWSCRCSTGS